MNKSRWTWRTMVFVIAISLAGCNAPVATETDVAGPIASTYPIQHPEWESYKAFVTEHGGTDDTFTQIAYRSWRGLGFRRLGKAEPPLWAMPTDRSLDYILAHPDRSSYLFLMTLRKDAATTYARVPDETKAVILCDALSVAWAMYDWGAPEPGMYDWGFPPLPEFLDTSGLDREAAQAMAELSAVALPHLWPLLDDTSEVHFITGVPFEFPPEGEVRDSRGLRFLYRRCDYAYRYIMQILGEEPIYQKRPSDRDDQISRLKERYADGLPGEETSGLVP